MKITRKEGGSGHLGEYWGLFTLSFLLGETLPMILGLRHVTQNWPFSPTKHPPNIAISSEVGRCPKLG